MNCSTVHPFASHLKIGPETDRSIQYKFIVNFGNGNRDNGASLICEP